MVFGQDAHSECASVLFHRDQIYCDLSIRSVHELSYFVVFRKPLQMVGGPIMTVWPFKAWPDSGLKIFDLGIKFQLTVDS